jgi:hypothetical protein
MTILRLTDGTTTVDLIWHSAANHKYIFARDGGAPVVAGLRSAPLGGVGPYADVVEERTVHISGDSALEVLQNQARLVTLLRQAERWDNGEPDAVAVLIQEAAEGGQLLESVVLGSAQGDDSGVRLSPSFHRDLNAFMSQNVRLRYRRRGLWLGAAEASAASASTGIGSIWTLTLPSTHDTLSPVQLKWTAPDSGRGWARGPLIVAQSSSHLAVVEAELMGAAGDFTVATPVNTLVARGTQTLQFTRPASPGGLGSTRTFTYANIPTLLKSGPKTVDVWAVVYGGAAGNLNQLYLSYRGGTDILDRYTPVVDLPSDDGYAYAPVFVGTLDVPEGGIETLGIGMYGQTAGDVAMIDYFVFAERRSTTFVITPTIQASANIFGSALSMRGVWDPYQTTYPDPLVAVERVSAATRAQVTYQGNPWLGAAGSTMAGIWLATDGLTFRYPATAGGTTAFNSTYTAIRRRGYLTPE